MNLGTLGSIGVGGDPRSFPDYRTLCNELARANHVACPPLDWPKVERCCLALFELNGAELQSAAAYTLARGHLQGIDGLYQGLALVSALVDQWLQLWPAQAAGKREALVWLFTQLQPLLRQMPMNRHSVSRLGQVQAQLQHLEQAIDAQPPVLALQALQQQLGRMTRRLEALPQAAPVFLPALPRGAQRMVLQHHRAMPPAPREWRWQRGWLGVAIALMACGWAANVGLVQPEATRPLGPLAMFEAGSAVLKPAASEQLVGALVAISARPPGLILITGHADASGDAEQNLQLSRARAAAVRDWMRRVGNIPDGCLAIQGVGDSQPLTGATTQAARALQRRVDIDLLAQACG